MSFGSQYQRRKLYEYEKIAELERQILATAREMRVHKNTYNNALVTELEMLTKVMFWRTDNFLRD